MAGYSWWNVANTGAVVPPPPPDVSDGILVPGGSSSGVPGAPAPTGPNASYTAIGAVAFDIAPDEFPDKLTLKISGQAPPTVGVVACPSRTNFPVEQNGPWSHVPAYDCAAQSVAILNPDAGTVTFNGLTGMVRGTRLSMVLLPGQLDRVVFQKPTTASLAVTNTGGQSYAGTRTTDTFVAPVVTTPAPAVAAPATTPDTEAPTTTAAPAPEVAAPAQAATQTAAAQEKKDDSASNRIAAALALLLVIGVFVWIDRVSSIRAAVLGRAGGPRGVGRFMQDRTGPPPRL
jgi:hypothetical protein